MYQKTKINIFVLIAHFYPGTKMGGPVTSIGNLVDLLGDVSNITIVTSNKDLGGEIEYKDTQPNKRGSYKTAFIYYLSVSSKSWLRTVWELMREYDRVIYINSLFSLNFSILVLFLRRIMIIRCRKIVIAPRGELLDESLKYNWYKKNIFLKTAKLLGLYRGVSWHATSSDECKSIIKNIKIIESMVCTISNIPSKPNILKSDDSNPVIQGCPLKIIHIARLSKEKRLLDSIISIKKLKTRVLFDIYGSIEDRELFKKISQEIAACPENIKIRFLGYLDPINVFKVMSEYDLFILQSVGENFGHSIIQALSCGIPVIASDDSPWQNLSTSKLGWNVNSLDHTQTANVIEFYYAELCLGQRIQPSLIRSTINQIISDPFIMKKYIQMFNYDEQ